MKQIEQEVVKLIDKIVPNEQFSMIDDIKFK